MARKVIETLIDDIDGGEADRTVPFGFDGVQYEIDLSEENVTKFHEALAPWIEKARRSGGGRGARGRSAASARRKDLDAIRQWARANGHQVSDRGRVPNAVVEAYDASH